MRDPVDVVLAHTETSVDKVLEAELEAVSGLLLWLVALRLFPLLRRLLGKNLLSVDLYL